MKKLVVALIVLFAASGASAGLTGLGIGIHGGIISGYDNPSLETGLEGFLDTLGVFDMADFEMPDDMKNFGAHVNIGTLRVIEFDIALDYAWQKKTLFEGAELKFNDFSISGSVRKSFPIAVFKPYVGAGLATHIMAYTIEYNGNIYPIVDPNEDVSIEDETVIGYHFKAGVALDFPLFPLTPYAEWKYNTIQTSGESSKYSQINLGITLDLP